MNKFKLLFFIAVATIAVVLLTIAALKQSKSDLRPTYHPDAKFNEYWYTNEAEITHFDLKQARYGEIRDGDAVMIFVTEHLSPETYLKAYNEKGTDIPILKLNFARKFITGVYSYSVMNSILTPVDLKSNPNTLRNTFSSQEWCGQVFSQLDIEDNKYEASIHSYFPEEGSYKKTVQLHLMEDEMWNRIRIDQDNLPEGNIMMIPSMQYLRFLHIDLKPYPAIAKRTEAGDSTEYAIEYQEIDRKLSIWFENQHPFRILKWEEIYGSGFGDQKRRLTTEAIATHSMKLEYWTKNANKDESLRKDLGF